MKSTLLTELLNYHGRAYVVVVLLFSRELSDEGVGGHIKVLGP